MHQTVQVRKKLQNNQTKGESDSSNKYFVPNIIAHDFKNNLQRLFFFKNSTNQLTKTKTFSYQ